MMAQLRRLQNTRPKPCSNCTASSVALFREYLRRSALWADRCNCRGRWPLFDIAEAINPKVVLDDEVSKAAGELGGNYYKKRIICWHLKWVKLSVDGSGEGTALPPPYEPLIRLYERGGSFTTEGRIVDLPGAAVHIGRIEAYIDAPPFVTSLQDQTLDNLDLGDKLRS
jgi:hypothetical protein